MTPEMDVYYLYLIKYFKIMKVTSYYA